MFSCALPYSYTSRTPLSRHAFGISTSGATADVTMTSLWRNSWGNLVAESYETDATTGRVTAYTPNSNLAAASSCTRRTG